MPSTSPSPTVRLLARFSLAAFVAVIFFGTVRSAPTSLHATLAALPEAERAMASFHAHFDALCFVGSAALALALHLLGEAGAPAWAARVLGLGYVAGSVVFSAGYAVKSLGLAFGLPALVRPLSLVLISGGGLLLIAAAGAAVLVLRGSRRASP